MIVLVLVKFLVLVGHYFRYAHLCHFPVLEAYFIEGRKALHGEINTVQMGWVGRCGAGTPPTFMSGVLSTNPEREFCLAAILHDEGYSQPGKNNPPWHVWATMSANYRT